MFCPGKDKETSLRNCRGFSLAEKSSPVKSNSWPKVDTPWSNLHIDLIGPRNESHYLVVVGNFSK